REEGADPLTRPAARERPRAVTSPSPALRTGNDTRTPKLLPKGAAASPPGGRLGPGDVVHHLVRPAVDVDPLPVTDPVLRAGHVDQVVLRPEGVRRFRLQLRVAVLLVGQHDHPVGLLLVGADVL